MPSTQITLINKLGLHARAATKFVQTTGSFAATVRVRYGKKEVDGKSIMAMMMLAARVGSSIEISAEGEDADLCLTAVTELINNRFGEEE